MPPVSLNLVMWLWLGLALLAMLTLFFVDAPYGKQHRQGWGPAIPNRLAWCLMESVVLVSFWTTVQLSGVSMTISTSIMAALLTLHYLNRSFVYPWRTRTQGKTMPATILISSMLFNGMNGFLLGADLAALNRPASWLGDPRFAFGLVLFAIGMALNWQSDHILLHLRKPGETGYRIPYGGAFRWVTSPNLLGEIVEWLGFAILTWSFAGLAFFLWTCANLIPRARANQRWYREHFVDYPPERRTLVPYFW